MSASPHLLRLYWKTFRRYRKISRRYQRDIESGEFFQNALFEQRSFLDTLRKIRERFLRLRAQLRLAIAGGVVFIGLSNSSFGQTSLGPFELQSRSKNPLREPLYIGQRPSPATPVDIDGDGDLDLFSGNSWFNDRQSGYHVMFYKNEGSASNPLFEQTNASGNPFFNKLPLSHFNTSPSFGDINGDGKIDAVIGDFSGVLKAFRNTGTVTNPQFEELTGANNPFNGVDCGEQSVPHIADIDNDGDNDVIVGSRPLGPSGNLRILKNEAGVFTQQTISGVSIASLVNIAPATIDIDLDEKLDLVITDSEGDFRLYLNKGLDNGTLVFEQAADENNPFVNSNVGEYTIPAFADLDDDGDLDLLIGAKYNSINLYYFKNEGGAFIRQNGLLNPFGGADVGSDATPAAVDIDNDGLIDIISGPSSDTRNEIFKVFKNTGNGFQELSREENPFRNVPIPSEDEFTPSIIDLNGDGFKDVVGAGYSEMLYHKNNGDATFTQDLETFSFVFESNGFAKSTFGDIDDDGDYDMFLSDNPNYGSYTVRFFQNEGTATEPNFVEKIEFDNPARGYEQEHRIYPELVDIDHDGDLDLIVGEGGTLVENYESNEFTLLLNVGTSGMPIFENKGDLIPQFNNAIEPSPAFIDYDRDGDLDLFQGDQQGTFKYYLNTNPAPVTQLTAGTTTSPLNTGTIAIDPGITLSDSDADSILYAVIKINSADANDQLSVTIPETSNGVTAEFNNTTKELTLSGKDTAAEYQKILRSLVLSFNQTSTSGRTRKGNSAAKIVARSISISVFDVDLTTPSVAVKAVSAGTAANAIPVFADGTITTVSGSTGSIDLKTLATDADGNNTLTRYSIVQAPASGATATIDANQVLTISYSGRSFKGSETLLARVCDDAGACDDNTITINVSNTAPVASSGSKSGAFRSQITIDLKPLFSDADNNLVSSTLKLIGTLGSGAAASIDASQNLVVNYNGLNFAGTETISFEVCDIANECSQSTVSITVNNTAPQLSSSNATTGFAGIATVNLNDFISDADNNLDLSTLKVTGQPASGAVATISSSGILTVNYANVNFAGNENVEVEVCDLAASCTRSNIGITVNNSAPVIAPQPVSTQSGDLVNIDLLTITSDNDNNLLVQSFTIISQPSSGATAEIVNGALRVDYSGITFSGTDQMRIRVCDAAGACTENEIAITVNVFSEVVVYNAVAPNGMSADNQYLRIEGLPVNGTNKVSIFNRWGDKVFEVENYDNNSRRFDGRNDNGNELPSGSYFYKIEYTVQSGNNSESKLLTGYLALKQ
jgi:gliding motility-associated-like protein